MANFIRVRNNTSFPYIVKKFLQTVPKDDILQYHQKLVHDYVMKYSNLRGLLIYHKMGSGKTILALSLCESLQRVYPTYKKLILVQKSLQGNVIRNMEKINVSAADYVFVSSNANNLIDQLDRRFYSFEDIIIVIDEAHNFFNSVISGSSNAITLYTKIMNAKRIKLFLLSGTLIVNDPFELSICFNMLHGSKSPTILPEYYETFNDYFVNTDANDNKFMARIVGLCSFYESVSEMPEEKPLKIISVGMSKTQQSLYLVAKKAEEIESAFGMTANRAQPLVKKNSKSSSYKINTRQICNMLYPEEAYDEQIDEYGKKKVSRNATKLPASYFSEDSVAENAPKLIAAYKIIMDNIQYKGYVYSQFLDSGLHPLGQYLSTKNFEEFSLEKNIVKDKHRYCFITGELNPDLRERYISIFNSAQNKDGSIIRVLLLSAAMAQGISLNEMRYVILFESYWNWTRIIQIIYRGIRYDSHLLLPKEERNITPYILISDLKNVADGKVSTDREIFERAQENQIHINKFLKLVKRASIDCFATDTKDCFECKPTDVPLYIEDISKDLQIESACEKWTTEQVQAKEIVYEKETYYYMTDENNVIHIYKWNEFLNSHVEIFVNDPAYKYIYEQIRKKRTS